MYVYKRFVCTPAIYFKSNSLKVYVNWNDDQESLTNQDRYEVDMQMKVGKAYNIKFRLLDNQILLFRDEVLYFRRNLTTPMTVRSEKQQLHVSDGHYFDGDIDCHVANVKYSTIGQSWNGECNEIRWL